MTEFEGKSGLITGGASGIGLAAARILLERGANVMLVDVSEDGLKEACNTLNHPNARMCAADVSKPSDTEQFTQATLKAFGAIDFAILNVGIAGGFQNIVGGEFDLFKKVMDINVSGTFLSLQSIMSSMGERGGGNIALTASTAGLRAGAPSRSHYVASKHAVLGLMRAAAAEGAPMNIRVNAVSPGGVDTPMTASIKDIMPEEQAKRVIAEFESTIPLKRLAQPNEIAENLIFLISDRSSYCTATNIVVDGGLMG